MKLAPPPLTIGDDGFDENTDLFGFKAFAERFANLVEALDSSTVFMLDGPWGSGKTTFARQWTGLLRRRGHAVVYFDAFANDYQDDAFVALAGEVYACAGPEKPEGFDALKDSFLKSAAGIRKTLPSAAVRIAVNFSTQGTVPQGIVAQLTDAIESAHRSQLEKRIAQANGTTQAVGEFRDHLSALVRELPKHSTAGGGETKRADESTRKFIFIIDELDRCRPTFALNLLERVKHLFSVDEICFVLVAHLAQLAGMVEKEYGVANGERYLEKFHHQRVTLPVRDERHQGLRPKYLEYLWKTMRVQIDDPAVLDLIAGGLNALAEVYDLPLRTLERIAGNVALVCVATHKGYFRFAPLVSGLCVMRTVAPETYEKARTGRLRENEATKFLRFDEWDDSDNSGVKWHKDAWTYATTRGTQHESLEQFDNFFRLYKIDRLDMIRVTCACIDDFQQRAAE